MMPPYGWLIAGGIVLILGCLWLAKLFLSAPPGVEDREGFRLDDGVPDIDPAEPKRQDPQKADNKR